MILYSENSVLKMRSSLTTTPRPSNGNDALLLVFLSLARVILQLGTTSGSKMARLTFFATISTTLLCLGLTRGSIYPTGHFEYVSKVTTDNADDFVKKHVDAGKTIFIRTIASEG